MIAAIFDTETSGLVANHTIKLDQQAEIIEFYGAVVDLSTGEILREVEQLIKPRVPLSDIPPFGSKKTISQITGITNSMLADSPAFKDVADRIEMLLCSTPYVIAHNVSFDQEMVDLEFERLQRKMVWPRAICTVEATAHLKGMRLSMTKLHKFLFDKDFPDAHRAKADTQALIRCAVELYKRGII
jgi:DNA polymerase-3 subunit epsilon